MVNKTDGPEFWESTFFYYPVLFHILNINRRDVAVLIHQLFKREEVKFKDGGFFQSFDGKKAFPFSEGGRHRACQPAFGKKVFNDRVALEYVDELYRV